MKLIQTKDWYDICKIHIKNVCVGNLTVYKLEWDINGIYFY